MSEVLLGNATKVIALARKLDQFPFITKFDHQEEKEAEALAYGLGEIEGSFSKVCNELLPRLMTDALSNEQAYNLLLDIGEELRHVLYHIQDSRFYSYIVEPNLDPADKA